jgi:hypothetical protein
MIFRVVRTAISPMVLLNRLELADKALAQGDLKVARGHVSSALSRLKTMKVSQDVVLDEAAKTDERQATAVEATRW